MVSMTNDKQDAEQQRDQTSTSASTSARMDQVRRLHADMNRQVSRTVDELRLLNIFFACEVRIMSLNLDQSPCETSAPAVTPWSPSRKAIARMPNPLPPPVATAAAW